MKLTAKDLRIGNWLQNNFGTLYQVTPSLILEFSLFGIKDKPIPLTEEWLLRLGFEKQTQFAVHWFKGNISIWYQSGVYYNDIDVEVRYVHELMNLFHSLSGKELTLNQTT